MIKDLQRSQFPEQINVFTVHTDGVHLEETPMGLAEDVVGSLESQRELTSKFCL